MLSNRSMPNTTVIPELACQDLRYAAQWLCRAFGFTPGLLIGDHRAQLYIDDGVLVLVATTVPRSAAVMVRVDNANDHFARARDADVEFVSIPATYPCGERQYSCCDPEGHIWTFSQSVADVDLAAWGGMLGG